MSVALAPHRLNPRPWQPLTDIEWEALRPFLPQGDPEAPRRRGRPRQDLRRTVDAIFWVAASSGPWKELPPELGRWATAHRTLSRWARGGLLEDLMVRLVRPAAPVSRVLQGLRWWLARSFRRMARILSHAALVLAKALGLVDAWPANPLRLPDRNLSKTGWQTLDAVHDALRITLAATVQAEDEHEREQHQKTSRLVMRAIRSSWRQLRLGVSGNRHQWRLK